MLLFPILACLSVFSLPILTHLIIIIKLNNYSSWMGTFSGWDVLLVAHSVPAPVELFLYSDSMKSTVFLFSFFCLTLLWHSKPKPPLISLKNGVLYKGPCFTGSMLCLLLLRMRGVFISVPFEPKPISTMVRLLENASALFDKGNCVLFFLAS